MVGRWGYFAVMCLGCCVSFLLAESLWFLEQKACHGRSLHLGSGFLIEPLWWCTLDDLSIGLFLSDGFS